MSESRELRMRCLKEELLYIVKNLIHYIDCKDTQNAIDVLEDIQEIIEGQIIRLQFSRAFTEADIKRMNANK